MSVSKATQLLLRSAAHSGLSPATTSLAHQMRWHSLSVLFPACPLERTAAHPSELTIPCGRHSLQCQGGRWLTGCILPQLQHDPHHPGLSQPPQPQDCNVPLPCPTSTTPHTHPTPGISFREEQHPGASAEGTGLMAAGPAEDDTYPGRVHHALGRAGRARGEHDEQRVAEGQLFKLELRRLRARSAGQELIQEHTVGGNRRNQR